MINKNLPLNDLGFLKLKSFLSVFETYFLVLCLNLWDHIYYKVTACFDSKKSSFLKNDHKRVEMTWNRVLKFVLSWKWWEVNFLCANLMTGTFFLLKPYVFQMLSSVWVIQCLLTHDNLKFGQNFLCIFQFVGPRAKRFDYNFLIYVFVNSFYQSMAELKLLT